MTMDKAGFMKKWGEKHSIGVSEEEIWKSELQILRQYKSEFKKLRSLDAPVSLSMLCDKLGTVRKGTIAHFLGVWVQRGACKSIEADGDIWYYFDVDIPEGHDARLG